MGSEFWRTSSERQRTGQNCSFVNALVVRPSRVRQFHGTVPLHTERMRQTKQIRSKCFLRYTRESGGKSCIYSINSIIGLPGYYKMTEPCDC